MPGTLADWPGDGVGFTVPARGEGAKRMTDAKSIQIILARQLASCIATPVLLVDAQNALIYYNEPAEAIFNHAAKAIEIEDIEVRVATLEQAAETTKQTP